MIPTSPAQPPQPAQKSPGGPTSLIGRELVGQLRSELRKTYSTKLWWALLIPAALLSMLVNVLTTQGGALAFTAALGMALALGSICSVFAVLYGVVCTAGEFRHRTITTTYLAEPRRALVIGAKASVAALVGVVYALVSSMAGLLGMLFAGALPDAQAGSLLAVCAVSVLTFALWAVFGVGIATLLNNQLAAIVTILLYLLLVEDIIAGLTSVLGLGQIEEYLPGGAAKAALTDLANVGSLGGGLFGFGALPWWLALLVFAGYTLVVVLAGAAAAQRRDIT